MKKDAGLKNPNLKPKKMNAVEILAVENLITT